MIVVVVVVVVFVIIVIILNICTICASHIATCIYDDLIESQHTVLFVESLTCDF